MKLEILKPFVPAGLIVLGALLIKLVLTGGVAVTTLQPGSVLGGAVSQSYGTPGATGTLPLEGKDFVLSDIHYFENNTWAVAKVSPVISGFNEALVIMKKINGSYYVVLGPGTAFSSEFLQSMPDSVANYIKTHGAIYEPVD